MDAGLWASTPILFCATNYIPGLVVATFFFSEVQKKTLFFSGPDQLQPGSEFCRHARPTNTRLSSNNPMVVNWPWCRTPSSEYVTIGMPFLETKTTLELSNSLL